MCWGSETISLSGKGGEVANQTPQRATWIKEAMRTTEVEAPGLRHTRILPPGLVALKARTTVRVLARTEEIATVNTTAKVLWRRRQVVTVGRPRNSKAHRAQREREMRSR